MKSYTVVNEVEALQRAYALWMYGAEFVCDFLCEGVGGVVCQEVAVIMLPSRSQVFQERMSNIRK